MIRLFSILFIGILLGGCATKEPKNKVVSLPYYNKDKANLYFINNETSMGLQIHFNLKISSKEYEKKILTCYAQYSYQELEEGDHIINVESSELQLLGKRDDHIAYKNYLKSGEIYIIKAKATTDIKAFGKQLFNPGGFSPDAKIELKEISYEEGLKELGFAMDFKGGIAGRYPFRAEENKKKDSSCIIQYF